MKVLCLRTCDENMEAYNGFKWAESGIVECDDWKPTEKCGNGLHGLLWGTGDYRLLNNDEPNRIWQVVEVEADDMIDLDEKVKFKRCNVIYTGDRDTACKMVADAAPVGYACHYLCASGGHRSTLTGGHR